MFPSRFTFVVKGFRVDYVLRIEQPYDHHPLITILIMTRIEAAFEPQSRLDSSASPFLSLLHWVHLTLLYFETCSYSDTCPDATRASRQRVSPFTKSFSADRVRLRGFCLVGTHDRTWRHWNYATLLIADARCDLTPEEFFCLLVSRFTRVIMRWSSFLRNWNVQQKATVSNQLPLWISSILINLSFSALFLEDFARHNSTGIISL